MNSSPPMMMRMMNGVMTKTRISTPTRRTVYKLLPSKAPNPAQFPSVCPGFGCLCRHPSFHHGQRPITVTAAIDHTVTKYPYATCIPS